MLFAGAWRAAFAIGCLILYSLFVEAGSPCLAQDPKITFHGDIGTGQASGASTGSMALSRYELNFGVARDLGRPCKAKAAYRVRVDRYLSPSTEYDFDLREAWLTCRAGDWLFSAGRQTVAWGKADGFPVLDAVQPLDYREFFLDEHQSARRPLAMIRAEKQIDGHDFLQAIYIPEKRADILPRLGDRFAEPWIAELTLAAEAASIGAANSSSFSKPQGGLKWEHNGTRLGWTANALNSWASQPYYSLNAGSGLLESSYYRRLLAGSSLDLQWSKWVVRGEATYLPVIYLPTPSTAVEYLKYAQMSFVVGADRSVHEWLLSGQFFRTYSSRQAVDPVNGRAQNFLTVLATRSFRQDRLKARAFAADDVTHHGAWVEASLSYDLPRNYQIKLGGDWFRGGAVSTFGELENENRIKLDLKWSF
jgi:hypothetical protein